MTPDEIRGFQLEARDPEQAITGNVQDCAYLLREVAAQLAEANTMRKPRWVNISSTSEPWLLDATQAIGLKASHAPNNAGEHVPVVYIRIRGLDQPYRIWDRDHDEVRGLLGIGEDWMNPIVKPPTGGRYMAEADYAETMAIIDVARKLAEQYDQTRVISPDSLSSERLNTLVKLFDSYDGLPF